MIHKHNTGFRLTTYHSQPQNARNAREGKTKPRAAYADRVAKKPVVSNTALILICFVVIGGGKFWSELQKNSQLILMLSSQLINSLLRTGSFVPLMLASISCTTQKPYLCVIIPAKKKNAFQLWKYYRTLWDSSGCPKCSTVHNSTATR